MWEKLPTGSGPVGIGGIWEGQVENVVCFFFHATLFVGLFGGK